MKARKFPRYSLSSQQTESRVFDLQEFPMLTERDTESRRKMEEHRRARNECICFACLNHRET